MTQIRCLIYLLFFGCLATPPSSAQGLCQLVVKPWVAKMEGRQSIGGGFFELELVAVVEGQLKSTSHSLFFASQTSPADVVGVLESRLVREGFQVNSESRATSPVRSLFIEDVLEVDVRASSMSLSLVSCDAGPCVVRVQGSAQTSTKGKLRILVGTRPINKGAPGTRELEINLEPEDSEPAIAHRLLNKASEAGWISERPQLNAWKPVKLVTGERITGTSVSIENGVGWLLSMRLDRAQ